MNRRNVFFELATLLTVLALSALATWALLSENVAYALVTVSILGLSIIAFTILRFTLNPDHLRARESERVLGLANKTQQYLRGGLTIETAQEVCRSLLPATDALAVAVTDTTAILGFAGAGEDHHTVGGRIITKATFKTLEDGHVHLLRSKDDIGCPDPKCVLKSAIVVPLKVLDHTVGTLKFYYSSPRALNESRIAIAKGMGSLLSTQLGISELDRQTDLALKAELRALQSQINPHFLFNTINTIASLIRTDPNQARILLREFAVFYRRTLENADDLIPLSKELEQTRRYLGFEIARFGDKILVISDIDANYEDMEVPAFIIQPIVENSVNHGMTSRPLTIKLDAHREDDDLVITVSDDGSGIEPDVLPRLVESVNKPDDETGVVSSGMGIALRNVDDRLKGYFGGESGITITSEVDKGTTVRLCLCDAFK